MSDTTASTLGARYREVSRRRRMLVFALLVGAVAALAFDIATGPVQLSFAEIIGGLFDASSLPLGQRIILWDVRLPDSLIAVVVGAALGIAGLEMQTILNNPLASPFTLGLAGAAGLGAATAIALPFHFSWLPYHLLVPGVAFAFTLGAGALILLFARLFSGAAGAIVLFGIALLFLADALTAILLFISSDEAVRQIVFWRLGDLTKAGWPEVGIVAAALLFVLPFTFAASATLTALRGGEEIAKGAGLKVAVLRRTSLLRISALTAVAVAFVGVVSFIGLVSPHIARLLVGEDHRFLIPATALTGAGLLSLASCLSKVVIPGVIVPVGIATAVVGVPIFVALIIVQRRVHS
jgi:iron complex transport system permease protein